mmetsp:Transcript_23566/g.38886  ORF Transcript_23566/g.38886 Transcript_23566/m.38886 type:complete len:296 (+) Transcript_23566:202-1089(+)
MTDDYHLWSPGLESRRLHSLLPALFCTLSALGLAAVYMCAMRNFHRSIVRKGCGGSDVWVIRHGEKSATPAPGSPEALGLNSTGLRRAEHLQKLAADGTWPSFTRIYATSFAAPPHVLREAQTVWPLAATLNLPVDLSFAKEDTDALARFLLALVRNRCGERVLISWEHCRIPQLLVGLGCTTAVCSRCWADGVYDELFQLHYTGGDNSGPPELRITHEGFARDVPGYHKYECAGSERIGHTHCQLPNGTWLGSELSLVYSAVGGASDATSISELRTRLDYSSTSEGQGMDERHT